EPSPKRTRFQCKTCEKIFARKDILKRHLKIHDKAPVHKCNLCDKTFNRLDYLKKHQKVHEKRAVEREFKCNACGEVFRNVDLFRAHIKSAHPHGASQSTKQIRKRPQNDHQEETAPKKSKTTPNTKEVNNAAASSSWESDPLVISTNVYIPNDEPSVRNIIRGHPIGRSVLLPHYILNNRGIISLDCHERSGQPYRDQLCFFRCLALHNGCHLKNLERDTKHYFERYLERFPQEAGIFQGIKLEELSELEKLYEINIAVYSLEPDNSDEDEAEDLDRPEIIARLVQRSHRHYTSTLYLNLYKYHFSYIKSLTRYSKSYQCSKCGKYWKNGFRLNRHELKCEPKTRLRFPGAAYVIPPTIFEQLADEGIQVPDELRYFKYFATFDFESMLDKSDLPENTTKLTWVNKHVPLSFSVCSNVPGSKEPKCFITNGNSHAFIKQFVDYLVQVSRESYRLLLNDFEGIFASIDEQIGEQDNMQEMVELLVGLQEESEQNDRGIDVMMSDDEEAEIESENDEDRAFLDDGEETEEEGPGFYRALNRDLDEIQEERVEEERHEETEEQEKKKPHPLVKLKISKQKYNIQPCSSFLCIQDEDDEEEVMKFARWMNKLFPPTYNNVANKTRKTCRVLPYNDSIPGAFRASMVPIGLWEYKKNNSEHLTFILCHYIYSRFSPVRMA
ncbi:hypothetical protein QZH41_017403, partial [Actinostola sp. cb2023]